MRLRIVKQKLSEIDGKIEMLKLHQDLISIKKDLSHIDRDPHTFDSEFDPIAIGAFLDDVGKEPTPPDITPSHHIEDKETWIQTRLSGPRSAYDDKGGAD